MVGIRIRPADNIAGGGYESLINFRNTSWTDVRGEVEVDLSTELQQGDVVCQCVGVVSIEQFKLHFLMRNNSVNIF